MKKPPGRYSEGLTPVRGVVSVVFSHAAIGNLADLANG